RNHRPTPFSNRPARSPRPTISLACFAAWSISRRSAIACSSGYCGPPRGSAAATIAPTCSRPLPRVTGSRARRASSTSMRRRAWDRSTAIGRSPHWFAPKRVSEVLKPGLDPALQDLLAQLEALELAGRRLRQLAHELDAARPLVFGEPLAHEGLQRHGKFRRTGHL